ncbi:4'-phosphopantetheinyl transferase EntD (siderophore biosynthesis) [Roseovarius marisflavi]|uniref:Enterobactin synthase component D n=1 Tax=Roseovarius marisflavi TaxID=1054996 RepID=A0A1M7BLK3_9RHOB|nr:4'-phosphopantetheinyl transferase superfamily protein [Roseovarius marisflavi]SHL55834.1 4'-phosphopantetheinyl transferase EntD (siderophore biosynthesis) [Roseovarius marisflavi]
MLVSALRAVLPPGVALGSADPTAPETGLWPGESAAMRRAIPSRRREFAAGRRAARDAMATFDVPGTAIFPGPDRAPIWPDGITGSISHGGGTCLALVARRGAITGLGIDIEPAEVLPADMVETVCTGPERAAVKDHDLMGRVIFCAKEAAYKAQYPLSREMLEFHDLETGIDLDKRQFEARFTRACPPFQAGARMVGRIVIAQGLVAAVVVLSAP